MDKQTYINIYINPKISILEKKYTELDNDNGRNEFAISRCLFMISRLKKYKEYLHDSGAITVDIVPELNAMCWMMMGF